MALKHSLRNWRFGVLAVGLAALATRVAAQIPALSGERLPSGQLEIRWNGGPAFHLESTDSLQPLVVWRQVSVPPVFQNGLAFVQIAPESTVRFYRLRAASLSTISTSPSAGERGVSAHRETVLTFSRPLAGNVTLQQGQFAAIAAGRRLLTRAELSSDRRKASLFYLEPMPANTRVQVQFDATAVRDELSLEVDADGDGRAGGVLWFNFDTANRVVIANTAVSGRVFASELMPDPANPALMVNRPLPGVTVTVDGAEETLRAITDATGFFKLEPAPPGRIFVHVDGRTATDSQWPNGAYYPFVGKAWDVQAGRTDNLAGGTGEIFLPFIKADTLQPVSAMQDTTVALPSSVVATNPAFAGVSIIVPAGALFDDAGNRGGKVGLAPVPPDRLPEPLPPGVNLPIVITVQTDGAQNFDRPVPVCFPNVPDALGNVLAPGEKAALMSFDHDTGEWARAGSMVVSADGKLVCSDPGQGILKPGWHGAQSPDPNVDPGPPPPPPSSPPLVCAPPAPPKALARLHAVQHIGSAGLASPPVPFDCSLPPEDRPFPCGPNCDLFCTHQSREDRKKCQLDYIQCIRDARNWLPNNRKEYFHDIWLCELRYKACLKDAKFNKEECYLLCTICPPSNSPAAHGGSVSHAAKQGAGPDPDRLTEIEAAILTQYEQIAEVVRPFFGASQEVPQSAIDQIDRLIAEADEVVGGDVLNYLRGEFFATEADLVDTVGARGEIRGDQPPYPIHLAHEIIEQRRVLSCGESPAEIRTNVVRLMTEPFAQYRIFLRNSRNRNQAPVPCPLGSIYGEEITSFLGRILFFDPRTKRHGEAFPRRIAGLESGLSGFFLRPFPLGAPDGDRDGLPDEAEYILGTSPSNPDSDGDGIGDGAELDGGANPLDGRPATTGVIATVPVAGTAVDVAAFNDFAALALGTNGVAIFDVRDALNPILAGIVDTPGDARAVALDVGRAVVADGPRGAAVIDLQTGTGPALGRSLALGSPAVSAAAAGGFGFIGCENGLLAVIELSNGTVMQRVNVGARVDDLAVAGDFLFVTSPSTLLAYRLDSFTLTLAGSRPLEFTFQADPIAGRRRLAVVDGIAYVSAYPGYGTFDVRNPAFMERLSPPVDFAPNSFKQIAPTGSGFGLAAVGVIPRDLDPKTHNVQLWDLRNPRKPTEVVTQFDTPGLTRAVAVYNGIAFAADGEAGLQVINYLPADSGAQPPVISLTTSAVANEIEEGQVLRLTAAVSDDVQVRTVEFYLDGALVAADGNAPFEVRVPVPARSANRQALKVLARARDTGRNAASSAEIEIRLLADNTPPTVLPLTPADGAFAGSPKEIGVSFSEPMSPTSISRGQFSIVSFGADRQLATPDDRVISGGVVQLRSETRLAFVVLDQPLSPGRYRAEFALGARDIAGNAIRNPIAWEFQAIAGEDIDGDGMTDDFELANGFDPFAPDGTDDADADGASNLAESLLGSDPRNPRSIAPPQLDGEVDRDGERLRDVAEVLAGTNPLLADSDGDSWNDEAELAARSNPLSALSRPLLAAISQPPVRIVALGSMADGSVVISAPPQGHVSLFLPRIGDFPGSGTALANPPVRTRIGEGPLAGFDSLLNGNVATKLANDFGGTNPLDQAVNQSQKLNVVPQAP